AFDGNLVRERDHLRAVHTCWRKKDFHVDRLRQRLQLGATLCGEATLADAGYSDRVDERHEFVAEGTAEKADAIASLRRDNNRRRTIDLITVRALFIEHEIERLQRNPAAQLGDLLEQPARRSTRFAADGLFEEYEGHRGRQRCETCSDCRAFGLGEEHGSALGFGLWALGKAKSLEPRA